MIVVAVAGLFAVVVLPETRGIDLPPIVEPDRPSAATQMAPADTPTTQIRPITLS